jgi:hypothetical protein
VADLLFSGSSQRVRCYTWVEHYIISSSTLEQCSILSAILLSKWCLRIMFLKLRFSDPSDLFISSLFFQRSSPRIDGFAALLVSSNHVSIVRIFSLPRQVSLELRQAKMFLQSSLPAWLITLREDGDVNTLNSNSNGCSDKYVRCEIGIQSANAAPAVTRTMSSLRGATIGGTRA